MGPWYAVSADIINQKDVPRLDASALTILAPVRGENYTIKLLLRQRLHLFCVSYQVRLIPFLFLLI